MKDQVQLSDKTKLSMPIANLIGLIVIVASVVFMYSEITGRLTSLETSRELFETDLLKKSTQLPTDQEQYMLLEHLAGQVEIIQNELQESRHDTVNLNRAMKDIEKMQVVIEEMKDKISKDTPLLKDLYPQTQHLWDMIDWDNWWFYEDDQVEYGGLAEWVVLGEKHNMGMEHDPAHPSEYSHEQFTKKEVEKWIC